MIVVIIAGGSGTRLWPLSTHEYPKQLLKINGDSRSLLQNTYGRARRLTDAVYVMPETRLTDAVREQLPDLAADKLIVEPGLRGTASCIVAALARLAASCDPDEPVAFLWADHHVRDATGFLHSFRVASEVSKTRSRIVLVGVEPDYPVTGLGYIEKGAVLDAQTYVYSVKSFKEKPAYSVAQNYVRSGNYLWNTGYMVGSVTTFTSAMQRYAPVQYANYNQLRAASSPAEYERTYLAFDNIPIDYAFTEKVPDLLVVPASFDWLDLGSFADMYKVVDRDEHGNHVLGVVEAEEVENSFIQNHEDKPLAVIGLDNVVVVNTPSGILVARKDLSQKVGEVSKRFKAKQ